MITAQKVIDKVNALILQKYPAAVFYIENIPEGFVRPSFFIELVNDGSKGGNVAITEENIALQITYFAPVDDYYNSNGIDKVSVCTEVKNIFRKGYMNVEDRAIKVSELSGTCRGNSAFISVTFEFMEDRPVDQESYELINEIITRNGGN